MRHRSRNLYGAMTSSQRRNGMTIKVRSYTLYGVKAEPLRRKGRVTKQRKNTLFQEIADYKQVTPLPKNQAFATKATLCCKFTILGEDIVKIFT